MSLDEIDLLLIEEFKEDPRQSFRGLARKLGMNRGIVRYRLDQLIDKGILTIVCGCNIESLGYQFLIVVGIKVHPGMSDKVASQLIPLPAFKGIATTAFHYDILAWAFLRDQAHLSQFITEELANMPDIESIEIMHAFKGIKDYWRFFKPLQDISPNYTADKFSDVDFSIIKGMQQDPRQSIANLARTVGCSKLIAKQRLEKLLEEGVIGFFSYINTSPMGYDRIVNLLIKCKLDKMNDVASQLANDATISHVHLITGQWQIIVTAQFPDKEHLYDYTSSLAMIPGVINFEVISLKKIFKYDTNYFTPT